ncbi:myosuppressin isoform X2 [Frankliniella occidentalis]|uniref:Myosuppressin isoform X2 n=1 Tax=Frankliniella occidentalis TaxID=133901 RepID=A0A6J1SUB9_FRAOC|nr:myosuppressin isoform X2 [Frankliniella occidentalis]
MRCLPVLSLCAVFAAVLLATGAPRGAQGMALPQCHPSVLQTGSDRIRKVCAALSTMYELSSAMESYLDDKGTLQMLRENAPLVDSGVKRQDVDHVFLRFGRRR